MKNVGPGALSLAGWITLIVGTVLWLYGYFVPGTPSLIDWRALTPWWIADFLPNVQAEVGMALVLVSMIPTYWPNKAASKGSGQRR
jgi:hypothetical protein